MLKSTRRKRRNHYAGLLRKGGGTGSRMLEEGWALARKRNRHSLVLGGKDDLTCANSMSRLLMFGIKEIKRSHQMGSS